MKNLFAFFEIPALDFKRTVNFYEEVFGQKLQVCECDPNESNCYPDEKMAFFSDEKGDFYGAISYCPTMIQPSDKGVIISLSCEDMDKTFEKIIALGGKKVMEKTKIESDKFGYCGLFIDCEGNKLGLYSDK